MFLCRVHYTVGVFLLGWSEGGSAMLQLVVSTGISNASDEDICCRTVCDRWSRHCVSQSEKSWSETADTPRHPHTPHSHTQNTHTEVVCYHTTAETKPKFIMLNLFWTTAESGCCCFAVCLRAFNITCTGSNRGPVRASVKGPVWEFDLNLFGSFWSFRCS